MENLKVASFADIRDGFLARVSKCVWCNVATVDGQGRPRSRILHPVWEDSIGWIITRRHSFKSKHLDQNPYVSLAYIADVAKPVYADCVAQWVDDRAEKLRIWDFVKETPPPLGYDPTPIFGSVEHEDYGVLKLTTWRIEIANFPKDRYIWHAPKE